MPSDEGDVLRRVHRAGNAAELHAAAKSLSRMRDATNFEVARYLQEGDKIYKSYVNDGKMKSSSQGAARVVIEEDDLDKLPTRNDLKQIISNKGVVKEADMGSSLPPVVPSPVHVTTVGPTDIFKESLWSEKSRKLYELIDKSAMSTARVGGLPLDFDLIYKINPTSEIGVKNTFLSCPMLPGTLDRFSSEWMFGNLKFAMAQEKLHTSEIESQILEPLTNMYNNFQYIKTKIEMAKPPNEQTKKMRKHLFDLKRQEILRDSYIPYDATKTEPSSLNGIFMEKGTTSNLPIMAGAVLKAVQVDGTLHLRPLCTTGDLLLALGQLLDKNVFAGGVVQMPDPHRDLIEIGKGPKAKGNAVGGVFGNSQTIFTTTSEERVYYRVNYTYRKHTKWTKFVFRDRGHNSAIKSYSCPFMCPEDFIEEPIPFDEVTPQMNSAVYMLRLACLPSQEHLSVAERRGEGEKHVSEFIIDFEMLSPIDPEVYKTQVLQSLKMKRLELQEKSNTVLPEVTDTNGHDFELRILNILSVKVVKQTNRVTSNSVTLALMSLKAANKFKGLMKKNFAAKKRSVIAEVDESLDDDPKVERNINPSTNEDDWESESDASTSVCPEIFRSRFRSESFQSVTTDGSCDDFDFDSDQDIVADSRRRSSSFQANIPRNQSNDKELLRESVLKESNFEAFKRKNSDNGEPEVKELSLEARQEAIQRKVLETWGVKPHHEDVRSRIENFREAAINNKLHMRKVSVFNNSGASQKNNIVTTIVGNRRVSVMNNIVIHSEVLDQATEPAQSPLLEKQSVNVATSHEPDDDIQDEKRMSVFQQRKETLGKLINKVDKNIAISEAASAVEQAAQMMPPTLLTLKHTSTPPLRNPLSLVSKQPPLNPRPSQPEIASSTRKQSTVVCPMVTSRKTISNKKEPSRKQSVSASRKKSVSVAKNRVPKKKGIGTSTMAGVEHVDVDVDDDHGDDEATHEAEAKKEEDEMEMDQKDLEQEDGDLDSDVIEDCDEPIEYSVYSVPSVLSNPEFNQKHTRRKSVKVPKSRSEIEIRDDTANSESIVISTTMSRDSIEKGDLRVGNLSDDIPTKSSAIAKESMTEVQRRESVQGLLQIYKNQDSGKLVANIQAPSMEVMREVPSASNNVPSTSLTMSLEVSSKINSLQNEAPSASNTSQATTSGNDPAALMSEEHSESGVLLSASPDSQQGSLSRNTTSESIKNVKSDAVLKSDGERAMPSHRYSTKANIPSSGQADSFSIAFGSQVQIPPMKVQFVDECETHPVELDMGSPVRGKRCPQQASIHQSSRTLHPSNEGDEKAPQSSSVVAVTIPVVPGVDGVQAIEFEKFRQSKFNRNDEIGDIRGVEHDTTNVSLEVNSGIMTDDLASSVLSSCRQSVSSPPLLPTSVLESRNEVRPIEFARVVVRQNRVEKASFHRSSANPFTQHVPSIEKEPEQPQNNVKGLDMESRNKELEYIIQLLQSGVKDTRYEERKRILHERRVKEQRLEKERRKYAEECDICLRGILNGMDPVLGERMAFRLRQRQDKRKAAAAARRRHNGGSCSSSDEDNGDGDDDNDDEENSFRKMKTKLSHEENLVETNLSQLHLQEVEDDKKSLLLDVADTATADNLADESLSLQQLDERSQLRSQYLAQESERLLRLKDQVEQRRKEAADRKLSILVKLTRRLKDNEARYDKDRNSAAATRQLVVLGNQAGQTPAQKRRAEQHSRAQKCLANKISKHVRFLHTHVIDMGDTAKLPYPPRENDDAYFEIDDVDTNCKNEENEENEENDMHNDIDSYLEGRISNNEHFPETDEELGLGSDVLEHQSDGNLAVATGSQVLTPAISVPEPIHYRSCYSDNESDGDHDEMTEHRIEEVVGSYNLTELKKFRLELIRYMNFINEIEEEQPIGHTVVNEDARAIDSISIHLENSSVNMQVDPMHLVDSINHMEVEVEGDVSAYLYDDDDDQSSNDHESVEDRKESVCDTSQSSPTPKKEAVKESREKIILKINEVISSDHFLEGTACATSQKSSTVNKNSIIGDTPQLNEDSAAISLGSVASKLAPAVSKLRSPLSQPPPPRVKALSVPKVVTLSNSRQNNASPMTMKAATFGDVPQLNDRPIYEKEGGYDEDPSSFKTVNMTEGSVEVSATPVATMQPTSNSVVLQMNVRPDKLNPKSNKNTHILRELPSRPLNAVHNVFKGRKIRGQGVGNAEIINDVAIPMPEGKDERIIPNAVHNEFSAVHIQDTSLESDVDANHIVKNQGNLEISLGEDTAHSVELVSQPKPRRFEHTAPQYSRAPQLDIVTPDPDAINLDVMNNFNKKYVALSEDPDFGYGLPIIGGDGMFEVEDTQNSDISFFSMYQEGPKPPTAPSRPPTAVARQPLRVNIAKIAKISSDDDMTGMSMSPQPKNALKGNPKPPNAIKSSATSTPPKFKRRVKYK